MKNKKKYKILHSKHIIFKILNLSLVNIAPGNFPMGGIHLLYGLSERQQLKVDMTKVYEMKNDNMYTFLIKDSFKLENGKLTNEGIINTK